MTQHTPDKTDMRADHTHAGALGSLLHKHLTPSAPNATAGHGIGKLLHPYYKLELSNESDELLIHPTTRVNLKVGGEREAKAKDETTLSTVSSQLQHTH